MGDERFKQGELYRTDAAQQRVLPVPLQDGAGVGSWSVFPLENVMAATPERKEDAGARTCPRCGTPFRCGALAGDARCWCASLPALPVERLDAASGCLCAACLEADIRRTEEGA
jgi:hypothetical protein